MNIVLVKVLKKWRGCNLDDIIKFLVFKVNFFFIYLCLGFRVCIECMFLLSIGI